MQIRYNIATYRELADADVHPRLIGDGLDCADHGELRGEGAVAACDEYRASKRQRGSSHGVDAQAKCSPVPTIRPVSANKDRTRNSKIFTQ